MQVLLYLNSLVNKPNEKLLLIYVHQNHLNMCIFEKVHMHQFHPE